MNPETQQALKDLRDLCPMPFVLDTDNAKETILRDCTGEYIFEEAHGEGFDDSEWRKEYAEKRKQQQRAIAFFLWAISKDETLKT